MSWAGSREANLLKVSTGKRNFKVMMQPTVFSLLGVILQYPSLHDPDMHQFVYILLQGTWPSEAATDKKPQVTHLCT